MVRSFHRRASSAVSAVARAPQANAEGEPNLSATMPQPALPSMREVGPSRKMDHYPGVPSLPRSSGIRRTARETMTQGLVVYRGERLRASPAERRPTPIIASAM